MAFKLLFLLVIIVSVSCTPPCSVLESVNVTTGIVFENGSVVHEGVEYVSGRWYEADEEGILVRYGCPCIGRLCLWKCCGDGQMFFRKNCQSTDMSEVAPFRPPLYSGREPLDLDSSQYFHYMYAVDNPLCDQRYLVDVFNNDGIYIQKNATMEEVANGRAQWHLPTTYCVDMMLTNVTAGPRLVALVCHPKSTENDDSPALYIAYAIGLMLSVPFLLATFLVYAFIPELRNLHGLCLMAYCAGLIVAYPLLAYLKLQVGKVNVEISGCMTIAFLIYYSFQSSFFWLNVMCFDIWRTFSGYRGGSTMKRREKKRFALYGLYAWGTPLILTCITIGMQFGDLPAGIITPNFGDRRCWFEDWLSELVYFFTPVLILVVCNVVLFSITAHRIRSIRKDTAILKSSESARNDKLKRDKQRYGLYLKLFVVMGVNWSVEVISFVAGGSNWYWIIIDLSNIALGVFIFFIFVWKNKVRGLVRKKFAKWRGVPVDGPSTFSDTSTGRWATRSSSAPTEVTRIHSTDDAGIRLKDMR